jgi:hypothetical protein
VQAPPLHTSPAPHGAQLEPQWLESVLVSKAHGVEPPQALNPVLHSIPQLPAVHVALPLAGTGHAVQLAPQWVASSPVE